MSATTRRSLLLTESNDIDISTGTLQFATGLQAVKQGVRSSILYWLGEWFLNTDGGTDWRGKIFLKNVSLPLAKQELRNRITRVLGVKSVDELDLTVDSAARSVTVSFSATADFGQFDDVVLVAQGNNP